jgi:hypothetical protein
MDSVSVFSLSHVEDLFASLLYAPQRYARIDLAAERCHASFASFAADELLNASQGNFLKRRMIGELSC